MNETIIQISEVQIFQEKKLVLDNINLNIDEELSLILLEEQVVEKVV